ncbi:MAG: hypothetical protein D8M58_02675 [Calditrichaeota bacterium]|nr:MAG: hypothetical protein DWQ03_04405 [Calditrichota bacterium]MBL1204268.1 hypothetical protein [Calditrichota bacterium]NOG44098.1 hypothetical protein [Calditrichota bacterium]
MTRLLLSLPDEMKKWLEQYSHNVNQPIAKTIRDAITEYIDDRKSLDTNEIIKRTAGIWKVKNIDGLEYSNSIRKDWDRT